jgi:uncharacterized protein YdhG (YjbR/CyaY superfamily)
MGLPGPEYRSRPRSPPAASESSNERERERSKGIRSAKSTTASNQKSKGFTDEERAAIKDRAQELKAEARANKNQADGESAVFAKLTEMSEPDRTMAKRLHAIIRASAPALSPRLWYGMPAYAKDGKVVYFFQSVQKFKTRYATLGFLHEAHLDEGAMWPTAFALKELTAAEEARIAAHEAGGEVRSWVTRWRRNARLLRIMKWSRV